MITSYLKPETLDQALDILSSGEFTPIAGGTDLIPQLRCGQQRRLLDISSLGLDFIKSYNGEIEIGAAATHARLCADSIIKKNLPILSAACAQIGSAQIRNRGTIGGNIVNASPCADTAPALTAFDADLCLLSKSGKRLVKLGDFIRGPYLTNIKPDEVLYSIRCAIPKDAAGFSYFKLGRRQAVNISRLTLAVSMAIDHGRIKWARIAGGSVFPIPARFVEVENLLAGQEPSTELFADAGKRAAESMVRESGVRWSTPYKKPVLAGLMARTLEQAAQSSER